MALLPPDVIALEEKLVESRNVITLLMWVIDEVTYTRGDYMHAAFREGADITKVVKPKYTKAQLFLADNSILEHEPEPEPEPESKPKSFLWPTCAETKIEPSIAEPSRPKVVLPEPDRLTHLELTQDIIIEKLSHSIADVDRVKDLANKRSMSKVKQLDALEARIKELEIIVESHQTTIELMQDSLDRTDRVGASAQSTTAQLESKAQSANDRLAKLEKKLDLIGKHLS
jgi:hypothetical protein